MTRRPLSLAALTVLELSPVQMARCAADAGFEHVGLRLLPATADEPTWDCVGDTPLVRELCAVLNGSGVRALDIEILRLKPDTRVADFAQVLETGARLGARCVLVAGNDPDEARLVERLAALADLARPYALTVCLEPMPWTDVRNFVQGLRIVESAARDNAGVLIDPIHFDRGGSRPLELAGVPPQRLPYLQFCDAPAERPSTLEGLLHQARAERLPPGQGGLDLAALLHAAPRDVPLSLEVPMATLARTMPALARARMLREATERWLALTPYSAAPPPPR